MTWQEAIPIISGAVNIGTLATFVTILIRLHSKQVQALKEANEALKEKNSILEVLSARRILDELKAKTQYYENKIQELEEGLEAEEFRQKLTGVKEAVRRIHDALAEQSQKTKYYQQGYKAGLGSLLIDELTQMLEENNYLSRGAEEHETR